MNQTIFKNVEKLLKNKTEAEKESFKAEIQQKQKLLHQQQVKKSMIKCHYCGV